MPGFANLFQRDFSLSSVPPPQLVLELLHEGQALSVGVSAESGHGGQWLARIRQLIKEGSVPDVSLVPVGISYDCATKADEKVHACKHTLAGTQLMGAICNCCALKGNTSDLVSQAARGRNVKPRCCRRRREEGQMLMLSYQQEASYSSSVCFACYQTALDRHVSHAVSGSN